MLIAPVIRIIHNPTVFINFDLISLDYPFNRRSSIHFIIIDFRGNIFNPNRVVESDSSWSFFIEFDLPNSEISRFDSVNFYHIGRRLSFIIQMKICQLFTDLRNFVEIISLDNFDSRKRFFEIRCKFLSILRQM